jgi:hypothetical protein
MKLMLPIDQSTPARKDIGIKEFRISSNSRSRKSTKSVNKSKNIDVDKTYLR